MIELDRALLAAFAVEMLEHIAACEQVLVRASTEPVYEQDFQLLLRSMHSIKGLARVLASTSLERLAHVAASLPVAVRGARRHPHRPPPGAAPPGGRAPHGAR